MELLRSINCCWLIHMNSNMRLVHFRQFHAIITMMRREWKAPLYGCVLTTILWINIEEAAFILSLSLSLPIHSFLSHSFKPRIELVRLQYSANLNNIQMFGCVLVTCICSQPERRKNILCWNEFIVLIYSVSYTQYNFKHFQVVLAFN